jgi:hypothetical protein
MLSEFDRERSRQRHDSTLPRGHVLVLIDDGLELHPESEKIVTRTPIEVLERGSAATRTGGRSGVGSASTPMACRLRQAMLATPDRGGESVSEMLYGQVGDLIEIGRTRVGEHRRVGEIMKVLGSRGHEHYLVRWEDDRETLFYPTGHASVVRRSKHVLIHEP